MLQGHIATLGRARESALGGCRRHVSEVIRILERQPAYHPNARLTMPSRSRQYRLRASFVTAMRAGAGNFIASRIVLRDLARLAQP